VQDSIPNRDERESASPKTCIPALASSQHPTQWVIGISFEGVKQPQSEPHHSTAASTDFKNGWRYTFASPIRLNVMWRNKFYFFPIN